MNRRQRRAHERKTGKKLPGRQPLNLGIKEFKRQHKEPAMRQMYKDEIHSRVKAAREQATQTPQNGRKASKATKPRVITKKPS